MLSALFTTQTQGFYDVTNRGLRRSRVFEIVLDQRVIEIQLTACRISAVAFSVTVRETIAVCGRAIALRIPSQPSISGCSASFIEPIIFSSVLSAPFPPRCTAVAVFQVFDQHAVVARHQVNFADTPVAVGTFQQMMGIHGARGETLRNRDAQCVIPDENDPMTGGQPADCCQQ